MKNWSSALYVLLLPAALPAFATVAVSSPSNGITVGASAQYTADATSTCRKGVAAMGIYVDDQLQYVVNGASLNKTLPIPKGSHSTFVQEWDYCGGSTGTPVQVTATNQSGVYVTAPTGDGTVGGKISFVASATTTCEQGVAAMGIYANNQLVAVSQGSTLNQQVALEAGMQKAIIQSWDRCGGSAMKQVNLLVDDGTTLSVNNTFSNIQAVPNWDQWGELAPVYDICAPCAGITWKMQQHVTDIALSGNATRFDIGGSAPYADVLWSNKLIGQGTTENMPDIAQRILPAVHNLKYEADFYVTNAAVTQDLEFDVNMYMRGIGMEWGTECDNLGGHDWDIWDNVNARWIPTGAPCSFVNHGWNHVTIDVARLPDNSLLYKTITLNGTTAVINKTYPPFTVPAGWYGMTVNYQMDGDHKMSPNTTYLDNLSVKYW